MKSKVFVLRIVGHSDVPISMGLDTVTTYRVHDQCHVHVGICINDDFHVVDCGSVVLTLALLNYSFQAFHFFKFWVNGRFDICAIDFVAISERDEIVFISDLSIAQYKCEI